MHTYRVIDAFGKHDIVKADAAEVTNSGALILYEFLPDDMYKLKAAYDAGQWASVRLI